MREPFNVPDLEAFRPWLSAVIYWAAPEHTIGLEIVDSVRQWSIDRGIGDSGDDPLGRAIRVNEDRYLIVLRRTINTHEVQAGIGNANSFTGGEIGDRLNTSRSFLAQLLLHEVAHIVLEVPKPGGEWRATLDAEVDCDFWALERLDGALAVDLGH